MTNKGRIGKTCAIIAVFALTVGIMVSTVMK